MQDQVLLWDIGLIIVVATLLAYFAKMLRQPRILAYVLAGVLIGPHVMGLITEKATIMTLSELGIAFLLFIVGLELDFKRISDVGRVSIGCGLGQIVLTSVFGYLVASYLGYAPLEAFYISFALTISSTMVVIKLLSDKGELNTLHGRISLGVLLVQDIVTIVVLASLINLNTLTPYILTNSLLKGLGLISIAIVCNRYLVPLIIGYSAKSLELLFLTALSWCFIFAGFAYMLGFSIAIGAFLGGISLASFPYNLEIEGRIRSLKDFFATIFFVSLGMQIPLKLPFITHALVFSLFVLIGTPVIMSIITKSYGYGNRTAVLTGLSLAQISEFSLILAAQGLLLGHISTEVFSMITFIAVVTITASSYFIMHDKQIYSRLTPLLRLLDKIPHRGMIIEEKDHKKKKHVILCGCHRMGHYILRILQNQGRDVLVVEYDPDVIKTLLKEGVSCIYGDIRDIDILQKINLKEAEMVISTIPGEEDDVLLVQETKKVNPNAPIFVTADTIDQALELYDMGVDYVILPRLLSGKKAAELVSNCVGMVCQDLNATRNDHVLEIEGLKEEELLKKYQPTFLRSLKKKLSKDNHK